MIRWGSASDRGGGGHLVAGVVLLALAACSGDDDSAAATTAGGTTGGSGGSSTGSASTGGAGTGGASSGGTTGSGGSGASQELPSAGCGQPPPPLGPIVAGPTWGVNPDYTYTIDVQGTERTYVLRYPANYDVDHAYPVVFLFHGTGSDGQSYDYTRVEQAAPAGGAIFVLPVGLDYEWAQDTGWETFNDDERDLEFFDAMWNRIRAEYCVDQTRVFASGHSIGGFMCNYLACERGDVVRAIAPIAGGGMYDWYFQQHTCTGQVAVKIIHGTADAVVDYSQGVQVLDYFLGANQCGSTTAPTGHPPCEQYDGCDAGYPVEMCAFDGVGHSDFDWASLGPMIWDYFEGF